MIYLGAMSEFVDVHVNMHVFVYLYVCMLTSENVYMYITYTNVYYKHVCMYITCIHKDLCLLKSIDFQAYHPLSPGIHGVS